MTTITPVGNDATTAPVPGSRGTVQRALLGCGIVAALLYVAMNVVIPMLWKEYSIASQTISELSAIDAPTRPLWVPLGILYTLLMTAFGWGIWTSARGNHPLRVVGAVTIASGVIGLGWPPMHLREVLAAGGGTLTDTLHIVWAAVTSVLFIAAIAFGAAALGRQFRVYSITTLVVLLAFGALTGLDAPGISANLPTPRIGVWERINIGAYMLWVVVLATTLLRRTGVRTEPKGAHA